MRNLRVLKHTVNDWAGRFGWEIQKKQVHLIDFIKSKKITTVLDVGANQGQYATGLRVRGYREKIVSFEPDPGAFGQLKAKAEPDPKWSVRNLAIGARDGEQT